MIGRTFLNRFRVDRLLCEGGMGLVYIARQVDQNREVVVKVLKQEFAAEAAMRERFRREIQVLSQFQHPYVVEFHGGSLDDPGGMFLVMEYVRGTALDNLLKQRGRLQPQRVGKILAQLCDVLQALHDHRIVHCDIKPSNIMVVHPATPCETIKLMDFGLAKVPTTLSLTALDMYNSGEVASGSPGYMSPEQASAADPDHRSDLYSVGIMLYELLTGRLPFERPSVAALLTAHRKEAPPAFAERCPGLAMPPLIETVVQKCLAKHPEQRPQSASELVQLFERALGREIVVPPKPAPRPASVPAAVPPAGLQAPPSQSPARQSPAGQQIAVGQQAPVLLQKPTSAPKDLIDPSAAVYKLGVRMPESMAMLKLRGFVQDLGGQLLEGEAGVVRVRLTDAVAAAQPWSGTWTSTSSAPDRNVKSGQGNVFDVVLRIERADPKQPNQLTITLTMRPRVLGASRRELKARYDKIHRELKAYLQAT